MTENTLHRVNTSTSYVSIRKRACSCSSRSSCSPARSTCSQTRSTCSSNISMSPAKILSSPCGHKRVNCNSLSPHINTCVSEVCVNRRDCDSSTDGDTLQKPRNRSFRNNGCLSERSSLINRDSPVRAASLVTTQGTICTSDRRHVTYLEDQI